MAELLRIIPKDNVAVALSAVEKGAVLTVDGITVTALSDIPAGHKIALQNIPKGQRIYKYGASIGEAACDIEEVKEAIKRVARLTLDFPEISELDINPIFVYEEGSSALDIKIKL